MKNAWKRYKYKFVRLYFCLFFLYGTLSRYTETINYWMKIHIKFIRVWVWVFSDYAWERTILLLNFHIYYVSRVFRRAYIVLCKLQKIGKFSIYERIYTNIQRISSEIEIKLKFNGKCATICFSLDSNNILFWYEMHGAFKYIFLGELNILLYVVHFVVILLFYIIYTFL